jgi:hypothetical protein
LPPPVGKNSRSTVAVDAAARSAWTGSVSEGRLSSTKASWNGRQVAFLGCSTAVRASA